MNFKVRHIFSKAGGSFDTWEGTLQFDGTDPASLGAEVSIQTASINTDNEGRDEHLRSAEFFNVDIEARLNDPSTCEGLFYEDY